MVRAAVLEPMNAQVPDNVHGALGADPTAAIVAFRTKGRAGSAAGR
jgi:hypothetical protein